MAIVAVLGASFSLRENEPNPCNIRLAEELVRICKELQANGHTPVVAVQWEIFLAFRQLTTETYFIPETTLYNGWYCHEIGQYNDGKYLGTKEVLEEAMPFFRSHNATHFVGVANAFIHQPYLYALARKDFSLMPKLVRGIGFDKESTQWWCRSWWQLTFQTVRLALGLSHGHNGRQAKV